MTARTDEAGWPAPSVAWYGIAVLMLAAILSLLDRQVLNLLVDPIRASLGLSDVQIGLLQGPAFTICYTLLGFPFGWWVDRAHRLRLVAFGIAVWSAATIGCGLADSFTAMFAARALVGVGEAVLAPATLSLVADYFSPLRRPVAMSVNGMSAHLGIGLSLFAGGALMAATRDMQPMIIGGLPPIEGWRLVFVACGAPGLLAVPLILLAREPVRRDDRGPAAVKVDFMPFVRTARRWIFGHFGAVSLIAIVGYAFMSWSPSLLIRRYGWNVADVGMTLGLLFLVLGPLGALAGGFLTRWRQGRGAQDAALRVVRLGAIGFTASIGSLGLPGWTPDTILVPLALAVFSMAATQVVAMIVIQLATPNALRGRIAAAYFIVTSLIGAGLGPLVAAGLTQYLFYEPGQIGLSLATMALVAGPIIVLALTLALAPFRMLLGARATAA